MSEQDPKEIELYGQVLNVEATMTLSLTKNGAVADGTDVNIAHVAFDNVEDGITNVRIDYEIISGNAVFEENNQKTIIKFTNSAVSSTVKLIDLSAESGQIKASPYFGPEKAPPPVEYKFSELPFKLSLAVTTDNQIADGVATDAVTATLVDSNNKPVANQQLNFSLPAGAAVQFKAGGQTTSASTGADGKTTVLITDTANADVTVSVKCALASAPSVTASIDIHFKAKPKVPNKPKLKVSYRNWDGSNYSSYACRLVIEAINDYNMPANLTITATTSSLLLGYSTGILDYYSDQNQLINLNCQNSSHGEIVVCDRHFQINNDKPKYFHISDSTGIIWQGYLIFVSAQIVDRTPY